jgi:hypothetical protein
VTAPVALFVYDRPRHTRQTVEALQANERAGDTDLLVFSDAPRNEDATARVDEVRRYVRTLSGFRSVSVEERSVNAGVDASIIDGVTSCCRRYGSVIVLEDDLVTSRWFLTFMNRALDAYRDERRVMQIAGHMFPAAGLDETRACFLPFTSSWGWATWQRSWSSFEPTAAGYRTLAADAQMKHAFDLRGAFDFSGMLERFISGTSSAWDIRWYLTVFLAGGLVLFPQKSLVHNIGFDGSGMHCPVSDFAGRELLAHEVRHFPSVAPDEFALSAIEHYLRGVQVRPPSWKNRLMRVLGA